MTFLASFYAHDARLPLHFYNQRCKKICFTRLLTWLGVVFPWLLWIWSSRAFILLYILVFIKAVSPFFLLPSPLLDAFTAHMPSPHAHYIYFDHMKCHCKERDVKTAREQPSRAQHSQPWRRGLMMVHPASTKWREPLFSVVLLSHTANAHTL